MRLSGIDFVAAGRCREGTARQEKRSDLPHSVQQFADNRAKNSLQF
jgi:hypothetical protein